MGNCLCSCFLPKVDLDDEPKVNDTIYCANNSNKKQNKLTIAKKLIAIEKQCCYHGNDASQLKRESIFSISKSTENNLDSFNNLDLMMIGSNENLSAIKPLNEHKLLVEIADMNLIEMTRQLYFNKSKQNDLCSGLISTKKQQSEDILSFDSGFCSRRDSNQLKPIIEQEQEHYLTIEIPNDKFQQSLPSSSSSASASTILSSPTSSIQSFDLFSIRAAFDMPNLIQQHQAETTKMFMPTNNLIRNFSLLKWSKQSMNAFKQTMFKMFYIKNIKQSITNNHQEQSSFYMDNTFSYLSQSFQEQSTFNSNISMTDSNKKKSSTIKRKRSSSINIMKKCLNKAAKSISFDETIINQNSNDITINSILNVASFNLATNFCRIAPKFLLRLYDVNFF